MVRLDVIETVQKAVFLEAVELEGEDLAVRSGDGLRFEIDGHAGIGAFFCILHQRIDHVLRQGRSAGCRS